MQLPFLKNKKKFDDDSPVRRKAESTHPDRLIETVSEELLTALQKKDRQGTLEALRAFISMINDEE